MSDTRYSCWSDGGKFIEILPATEIADMIVTKFNRQEKENELLREENKRLKEDAYKDSEIARLKEQNDNLFNDLCRGFGISEAEAKSIENWKQTHEATVHNLTTYEQRLGAGGAIGGTYSYHFIPTSIGTIGTVRCNCGEEFTFRDL